MSTPYHAMVAYLRALVVVSVWVTLIGVGVSRCYILYESYSQFTLQRSEEAWLRERCREPDFYTNMRQHTDLCAQVERRARQWALLHSLNVMFTTARLCGPRMCVEYANDLVVRGIAWPIALVLGIFVMTMPSIITRILGIFVMTMPSIITRIASRSVWRSFDSRARGARRNVYIDHFHPLYGRAVVHPPPLGGYWNPGFNGRAPPPAVMDEGDHHAPLIEGGICIEDDDGVELITSGVVRRRGKGIAPPRGGLPV